MAGCARQGVNRAALGAYSGWRAVPCGAEAEHLAADKSVDIGGTAASPWVSAPGRHDPVGAAGPQKCLIVGRADRLGGPAHLAGVGRAEREQVDDALKAPRAAVSNAAADSRIVDLGVGGAWVEHDPGQHRTSAPSAAEAVAVAPAVRDHGSALNVARRSAPAVPTFGRRRRGHRRLRRPRNGRTTSRPSSRRMSTLRGPVARGGRCQVNQSGLGGSGFVLDGSVQPMRMVTGWPRSR
jgi:hypothetical protein